LRDEQFGFWPRHSWTLQLARLFEMVTRIWPEWGKRRGFCRYG
jgi:hypothetical protein